MGERGAAQPWYLLSTSPSKAVIQELDSQWVVWLKHGGKGMFLPSLQALLPVGDSFDLTFESLGDSTILCWLLQWCWLAAPNLSLQCAPPRGN